MSIVSEMCRAEGRHLCRLCLGNGEELLDIFGQEGDNRVDTEPLIARIAGILQLEILENDNLPKWICKQCLHKVDDFTIFRNQCKQNERKLLQELKTDNGKQSSAEGTPSDNDEDTPTDDEETEMIVIDPTQDYESSNQSLPNDDYDGQNGILHDSDVEAQDENVNGSLVENAEEHDEGEEEEEEDGDIKCDTFPKDASNGLVPDGGSTNASPQKTMVFTCKYCDVAFAASSYCQLHEMQDHDLLAPYACLYCGYKTAIRLSLISHIRETHHISRPYICVQCNKGFPRRSDLKKHTFVHTGVRPYACDQCGKSFSRNTNLTKHMRIHLGLKPYSCNICPRSFANRADLMRHQKTHSGQGIQFSCARCGNTYARRDKLCNHERVCLRKHPKPDSFAGSLTQLSNNQPESTFVHHFGQQTFDRITSSGNANPPAELPPDTMSTTNFANTNSLPALPAAIPASPPSSTIYSCPECPKRFLSNASLHVHQLTHGAEDKHIYECPHCQKHTVGKREFERHLLVHSNVKPFGCKACGKKFSRKDKLHRHERIHQRIRSFSCPKCAAKFDRRDALASHLQLQCMPTAVVHYAVPSMVTNASQSFATTLHQEQLVGNAHEHSIPYLAGDNTAFFNSGQM